MKSCILIIEDEKDLLDILSYNFEKEGYLVKKASSGLAGLREVEQEPIPSMVVLDLMLPDMSGIDICKHIRSKNKISHIPVMMLTAKSEEIDKVVGFEVGADDYVTKPFSVREVLLRTKALLKRSNTTIEQKQEELFFGDLKIDLPGYRVFVSEEEVFLTALEFNLLLTLLSRKGRVQTREVLLSDVWEINADVTTRTVDTHVKRLREKIGAAGVYIETVRGVGYRFSQKP